MRLSRPPKHEPLPPKGSEPVSDLRSRKRMSPDARRATILAAALEVFSANGFAAARLDEVAQRAGVAKGTLYLYFPDKETLFEHLLTSLASPLLARLETLSLNDSLPTDVIFTQVLQLFQTEVLGTHRERILLLIISEGSRFPRIAEFYHREIISRGREFIRKIAGRGYQRGELPSDALAKFPQLFFAPLMVAAIWSSLFGKFDPLDVKGLLEQHRRLVLGLEGREEGR